MSLAGLTYCAPRDVVGYKLVHSRPPESFPNHFCSLPASWVSGECRFMVLFDNVSAKILILGNVDSSSDHG